MAAQTFCLARIDDRRNSLLVVEMRQIFLAKNNSDVYDIPATSELPKKADNGRTRTLRVFVGKVGKAVTIVAKGHDRAPLERRITQHKRIPRIKRLTFSPMNRESLKRKSKNQRISAVAKKISKELNEAVTSVKNKMDQKALQIDFPRRTSKEKTGESREPLLLPSSTRLEGTSSNSFDPNCDGKALSTLCETSILSKGFTAPTSRRITPRTNDDEPSLHTNDH